MIFLCIAVTPAAQSCARVAGWPGMAAVSRAVKSSSLNPDNPLAVQQCAFAGMTKLMDYLG